jgi:hypothetical protein
MIFWMRTSHFGRITSSPDEVRIETSATLPVSHLPPFQILRKVLCDMEHFQEREADKREKFILRLENEMLKFERRLPPAMSEPGKGRKKQ